MSACSASLHSTLFFHDPLQPIRDVIPSASASAVSARLTSGLTFTLSASRRRQGPPRGMLRQRRQARREACPAGIETAPAQPQRAADEGLPLEARWKAATAAEIKAVRDKAQRTIALAEMRKAVIAKKLDEIERAEPAKPRWFSLPGA